MVRHRVEVYLLIRWAKERSSSKKVQKAIIKETLQIIDSFCENRSFVNLFRKEIRFLWNRFNGHVIDLVKWPIVCEVRYFSWLRVRRLRLLIGWPKRTGKKSEQASKERLLNEGSKNSIKILTNLYFFYVVYDLTYKISHKKTVPYLYLSIIHKKDSSTSCPCTCFTFFCLYPKDGGLCGWHLFAVYRLVSHSTGKNAIFIADRKGENC